MTAARVKLDETRRQLRGVRTEVEVAADTILRLFEQGRMKSTPVEIRAACDAVGIPVAALRDARARAELRPYVSPDAQQPAISNIPATVDNGGRYMTEETARAAAAGRATGSLRRSKQPAPDATEHRCRTCKEMRPIDEFKPRTDQPGNRRLECVGCWKIRLRRRYLSVAQEAAMTAAGLAFTIPKGGKHVGLLCAGCRKPFAVGDHVAADVELRHEGCVVASGSAAAPGAPALLVEEHPGVVGVGVGVERPVVVREPGDRREPLGVHRVDLEQAVVAATG